MALPFLVGIAVGAGVVMAFNKSDKLKEEGCKLLDKSKELATSTYESAKQKTQEIKECIDEKLCKKEEPKEEVKEDLEVQKKPRGRRKVEKS